MDNKSWLKLYQKESDPAEVFILQEGELFFYITNTDKYSVNGKNFIIGSSEVILKSVLGIPVRRLESVFVSKDSSIKKLPIEKFNEGFSNFSFLLNISTVMAKQVLLTNDIIKKNRELLSGKEKSHKEVCTEYYQMVYILVDEYTKRKLPWLKALVGKYQNSLTYKQGEIFAKATDPVKIMAEGALEKNTIDIEKNSVICEEGAMGKEMFILQSGAIDVIVHGNRVATISEPGSVIGEIALLLGEKRSATLKAKNNVVLSKINLNDLKEVASKDMSVFTGVAKSLAKKHYNNVIVINEIIERVITREIATDSEEQKRMAKSKENSILELNSLRKELSDVLFKQDAPFLKERLSSFLLI